MSGGVDSAVAAALLAERGYAVTGVTMRLWADPDGDPTAGGCCSLAGVQDARDTCARLGIRHYTVDLQDDFARHVVGPFAAEYARGRTPNPCTVCNREVRFEHLARFARSVGASHVATGHYVRVRQSVESGRWELLEARCLDKDQSYMLYRLSQEQLAKSLFPLGELPSKAETRALAARLGLPCARRRDSQDICFVGRGGYGELLAQRSPGSLVPGPIIDDRGEVIGHHEGVALYTIGQRRRLPASARGPLFVRVLDASTAAVHVGPAETLLGHELEASDLNWVSIAPPDRPLAVSARIRYNAPKAEATVEACDDTAWCRFKSPLRAAAPGQSVVFYDGGRVLGGGVIRRTDAQGRLRSERA